VARQDEYDREFLEYEDPAIYKALMQQEASEQRPTYSNTGTMVQNLPDNVYRSGEGRRAVASALGNIIGDDYATGLIGGDPNKYAGLGALDAVGVGGAIDFADSWKFFNKINAEKTRVENELIEEGYERNSESFNNEVTNRMPEYHGKGEAFFHTLLAPLEIATLGATSKMVAGGRIVKNALNKKIDTISRKLMSLKGAPGALPVVAEATSGALPSGNLSDNIQAIRDSASKLRSDRTDGLTDSIKTLRDSAESLKSKKKIKLGALPNGESGVAKVIPPADNQPGIIAFHGSGANFDQFRLDKIGTGEGAQMYGHGLYFTDLEKIAKEYEGQLTPRDLDYEEWLMGKYKQAENNQDYSRMEMYENAMMHDKPQDFRNKANDPDYDDDYRQLANEIADEIEEYDPKVGATYKVEIQSKINNMLDYDEPLIDQPVKIQNAIRNIYKKHAYIDVSRTPKGGWSTGKLTKEEMLHMNLFPNSKGGQVYNTISEKLNPNTFKLNSKMTTDEIRKSIKEEYAGGESMMSKLLNKEGVSGIKYLDAGSRNNAYKINLFTKKGPYDTEPITASTKEKAEKLASSYEAKGFKTDITKSGTNNYVVFDEGLIKILAKYGIVGPVAATALSQSNSLGSLPSEEEVKKLNFRS
jgi:hypothetical protein